MSRLYDRVRSCIENDLRKSEIVDLWNHFAEQSSYERIYDMTEFDELVAGDRSYRDVKEELDDEFDDSESYFYCDDSSGLWTSTDDPIAVMDIDQLVNDIIESEGHGYPPSDVDDIFDGYAFEKEMPKVLEDLSGEELRSAYTAFEGEGSDENMTRAELQDGLYDALDLARSDYEYSTIYLMPQSVQEKFFEFAEPGLDYLTDNIGKTGPVPAEKALEIAGFDKSEQNPNLYLQKASGYWHRYVVKIKDGVIKSAEPENQKNRNQSASR